MKGKKAQEIIVTNKPTKIRTNINIDSDVIEFFQERASKPGADPYQTQMNKVLRAYMESEKRTETEAVTGDLATEVAKHLISDENFILAVTERVGIKLKKR
jgi:hypothetical protein